ncbi:MAG: hypothetical protein JST42_08400, partial [Bacteroidetes bacterium]|nr:hypothetical protein [Bacteroidota bacterium]
LFRVFQEALTNIARHAAATRVEIDLKMVGETICMNVRDNGKGLDPYAKRTGLHLGLLSMKERTSAIGGLLTIESVPGVGTVIHVEIPA